MNRFALEMKVDSAEITTKYDRRLEETNGYNSSLWTVQMRFATKDWLELERVHLNGLKVTLVFQTFKIDAIMIGWTRIYAYDYIEVKWQSVGPLRPL